MTGGGTDPIWKKRLRQKPRSANGEREPTLERVFVVVHQSGSGLSGIGLSIQPPRSTER